ncbi:unnamed protein product, partial [Ectocarpus sp. 12 AP-2014]
AEDLSRWAQDALGPRQGPGGPLASVVPEEAPELSARATHIYGANQINEDDESRLETFYETWDAYLAETKLTLDSIINTDETSSTPQGTKSGKAIVPTGTKPGARRSNSRESTTVVASIGADGHTNHPTIIYKGQRMKPAWIKDSNG